VRPALEEIAIAIEGLPPPAPLMQTRPRMAEREDKVRFAITIFYEPERLLGALGAFRGIGLGEHDIWLAGKPAMFARQSAISRALAAQNHGLGALLNETAAIGALPSGEPLHGTGGPALRFLQGAVGQNGKSCLDALLEGHIGALLTEADAGAIIATARTATPALQDQCMRILLRHSRHMVYSRECRHDASIGGRRPAI
jgi:hypothetical protein